MQNYKHAYERTMNCVKNLHNLRKIMFYIVRGRSRTAATSKMELFVIIVNGFQPLTIIIKYPILDVPAVLDPSLIVIFKI